MNFVGLPIIIRPRRRCERCGLMYLKSRKQCPHCHHLEDGPALEALRETQQARLASGRSVGMLFLAVALVLAALLLLAWGLV